MSAYQETLRDAEALREYLRNDLGFDREEAGRVVKAMVKRFKDGTRGGAERIAMKAWDVPGYTADADMYCGGCAEKRYGPDRKGRLDHEGNEVFPIFGVLAARVHESRRAA